MVASVAVAAMAVAADGDKRNPLDILNCQVPRTGALVDVMKTPSPRLALLFLCKLILEPLAALLPFLFYTTVESLSGQNASTYLCITTAPDHFTAASCHHFETETPFETRLNLLFLKLKRTMRKFSPNCLKFLRNNPYSRRTR